MTGRKNFLRTYVLKCGPQGKKGFEVGNLKDAMEIVPHISFSVEKSDTESPNTSKIQIWNLSDSSIKVLDKKDCVVELKAGYNMNMATLVIGDVTSVVTTADNANRVTEIETADGRVAMRDTRIKISYNGKVNSKDIYNYVAGQMGCSVVFAKGLEFKKFPNGYSYTGKAKNLLKKMARCNRQSWSMQDGVLQITKKGVPVSTRGYILSPETGLIGIPKRITIGDNTDTKKAQTGWEVEFLLNGAVVVNSTVKIKSETVSGYFLVKKITYDGDNFEGDWVCTAQLLKL